MDGPATPADCRPEFQRPFAIRNTEQTAGFDVTKTECLDPADRPEFPAVIAYPAKAQFAIANQ